MRYTLLITGSGGQGVLSAGTSLAASAAEVAYSTYVPWYGAAQRGGVAKCTVVLSDNEIVSPLPGKCMGMIAMTDSACTSGRAELMTGGLLIRNSSRCKDRIRSGRFTLLDVPADDIAKECGSERMANMVLIGALLGKTNVLPAELILNGVRAKLRGKSETVLAQNVDALNAGIKYGADPEHSKLFDNDNAVESKYGIEKTTVGEILDTPELRAIVERICPQVLDHPLLGAGRTFKFIDAIPYIKDMLKDGDLDKFTDELEAAGVDKSADSEASTAASSHEENDVQPVRPDTADSTETTDTEAIARHDSGAKREPKYSIYKTTVGEMLDTPEIRSIVERLFPQVLKHPFLKAGRPLKLVKALPFIKNKLKDGDVEKFQKELEKLG